MALPQIYLHRHAMRAKRLVIERQLTKMNQKINPLTILLSDFIVFLLSLFTTAKKERS